MSKRGLSSVPLPPAKRLHTVHARVVSQEILTFENAIYDELVLCIFSHLSWVDLCAAQTVNKTWVRLASDNELWRKQYLQVFGRSRLRGARGFTSQPGGRDIRPLPGRAQADAIKDWKWMFRISSNWKKGRCKVEDLPMLGLAASSMDISQKSYHTNILVIGDLTVTASSRPMKRPEIQVAGVGGWARFTIACKSKLADISHITALAMDQSPPAAGRLRLASFLSSGEFITWSLNQSRSESHSLEKAYLPPGRAARSAPIVHAVYHHPLLVTLSQSFSLSVYDLSSDAVRLSQTLTSFTSFPPTSLVLSTPSPFTYKLVLAYAIPVYPAHWSVGATELIIGGSGSSTQPLNSATSVLAFSSGTPLSCPEPMTVRSTRTIRTIDVPHGWVDERKLRVMREQWSRKVSQISDTQTDGKWVVLAPGDRVSYLAGYTPSQEHPSPPSSPNKSIESSPTQTPSGLQLYRLSLPPQSPSVSAASPKLTFVRTLHGQMGPITALALADGRCVSLGHNGSIWVWDLENGTGAEVAANDFAVEDIHPEPVKGAVVFDEKRIISALAGNVVVRRFDI